MIGSADKMKVFGLTISKSVKDKDWGFTDAALPRFSKGKTGVGVLICHGFGGSPANMRCLYDRAVAMGHTVSLPLLTGHAKTMADYAEADYTIWRKDVDEALKQLTDAGCERIILCGLSMGALLMADLAERNAGLELIDGLIMMCPPIKFKTYLRVSSFFAPLIPYVLTKDEFPPGPEMEMYWGMATRKLADIMKLSSAVLHHAASLDMPVLLLEAGEDNRVDPASFDILRERIPNAEYVFVEGAPHGITYSPYAERACDEFTEFFKKLNITSINKEPD